MNVTMSENYCSIYQSLYGRWRDSRLKETTCLYAQRCQI